MRGSNKRHPKPILSERLPFISVFVARLLSDPSNFIFLLLAGNDAFPMAASSVAPRRGGLPMKLQVSDFDIENGTLVGCGALGLVSRVAVLRAPPTTAAPALIAGDGDCGALDSRQGKRPLVAFPTTVAIKIVSKVQALQQKKTDGLILEKDALYDLGPHPNIAYLLGTMQSDDEVYFVLELLPRGDLLEHIRRVNGARRLRQLEAVRPCLSLNDVRLITAQLFVALRHCWSKGYVVRDVKAENVMFSAHGRAVLIDFDTVQRVALATAAEGKSCDARVARGPTSNHGVAVPSWSANGGNASLNRRITVSEIQGVRRMTNTFCGTAHYVAPETVGECVWSFSSDLWSLGCLVYHMVVGHPPFEGNSSYAVMKQVVDPSHPVPDLPHGLLHPPPPPLSATGSASSGGAGSSGTADDDGSVLGWRHANDFIQQLLQRDPTMRLGVVRAPDATATMSETTTGPAAAPASPARYSFDMRIVRDHPFFQHGGFGDAQWAQVDPVVANRLRKGGTEGDAACLAGGVAGGSDSPEVTVRPSPDYSSDRAATQLGLMSAAEADAIVTNLRGGGPALTRPSDRASINNHDADGNGGGFCLRYDDEPFHSDDYAEYVYRVADGPFDGFARLRAESERLEREGECPPPAAPPSTAAVEPPIDALRHGTTASSSVDSSDEEADGEEDDTMDVVDDRDLPPPRWASDASAPFRPAAV